MKMQGMEDTIAAVATPVGEGGIGIVRISGSRALAIADGIFVSKNGKKPSECASHTVHYGHVVSFVIARSEDGVRATKQSPGGPEIASASPAASGGKAQPRNDNTTNDARRTTAGEMIDAVLLTVMRGPKTYTREDTVEINCHGGIQAVKKVLDLVLRHGARLAEPGEFTKRAFLSGRIDLAQAEAVLDVIRAKTDGSLKVAMGQLEGALSRDVNLLRDDVIGIAAEIEAAIDFPDEELEIIGAGELGRRVGHVIERLEALVDSFGEGAVLREGVLALICGKPNVGKSSLMNLLLKRDRVIVSPVPGTTRDTVEELITIKGIPIRLVDTAGIARGKDPLERAGIQRSKACVNAADIALCMLDAATGITAEDRKIAKLLGAKKKLVIINKIDTGRKLARAKAQALFPGDRVIEISVAAKKHIAQLEAAITELVWGGDFTQGESAIVSQARHKELLDKALFNMVSVRKLLEEGATADILTVDLKEAAVHLGLVVGKSVSDDILDRIFERFCIGK